MDRLRAPHRPAEFQARNLPEALAAACGRFNPTTAVDANAVNLLLRFSGENTRSTWRLGWRVFENADYSEKMINIQRDWHLMTYLQAIDKMQGLIATGDTDGANYRELVGLYRVTGQYARASETLALAIDATDDPQTRLNLNMERIVAALKAEQTSIAEEILRPRRASD